MIQFKWFAHLKQLLILALLCFAASCQTVNRDNDDAASLHLQIAVGHIQNENYPLALKELLVAQDLNPRNPYVQSNLGVVYLLRERNDLAEEHFKKALSLKSDMTEVKNNLARIYIDQKKEDKAEKLLGEVMSDLTFIDYPAAYANYGLLEFNRQHYLQAVDYFKKSLEKNRENCDVLVYMGRCYLEQKEYKSALNYFNKATPICIEQNSDESHYYGAIAYFRNKQKDLSKQKFEELIKLFPQGKNVEKAQQMLDVIKKGNL